MTFLVKCSNCCPSHARHSRTLPTTLKQVSLLLDPVLCKSKWYKDCKAQRVTCQIERLSHTHKLERKGLKQSIFTPEEFFFKANIYLQHSSSGMASFGKLPRGYHIPPAGLTTSPMFSCDSPHTPT